MNITRRMLIGSLVAGATSLWPVVLIASDATPPAARVTETQDPGARAQALIDRGLHYLRQQQHPDGSWQQAGDFPALTAITIKTFVQDPQYKGDEPFLKKAFDKLLSYQKEDGSISEDTLATYNTAIAISALAESKQDQYKPATEKALTYLRQLQFWDKVQGVPAAMQVPESNPNYGGFGYNKKGKKADLSNLQVALDALHDAGLKSDDPSYQAALKFVTRTQNNSETNPEKWAIDDGGFIYTCAEGGASKAGTYTAPDGRTVYRSYGSMTYAGLKSMIYAGLSHDDPRVKAAWNWITHNWTLDENPGVHYGDPNNPRGGDDGLFYYYHTLARALRVYGQPIITDSKGVNHDWRVELIQKLAAQQSADGHWTGIEKWMESKPVLSTSYAVLALEEARQDLKEHPVVQ